MQTIKTSKLLASLVATIISLLLISVFSSSVMAQNSTGPKALRYQYDALGRLTFTEDSVNGNRDFDYDAAGNRLFVATGTASDAAAGPSVPAAPTGLTVRGPLSPFGGGYHMKWNSVPTAIRYEVKIRGGQPFTTTNTFADSAGPLPDWVRAINTAGGGPAAYFTDPNNPPSSAAPPIRSSSASSTLPVPAKPTGLNAYRFADCVYRATWSAAQGATSYEVYDTRGNKQTTSSLSVDVPCTPGQPESNKPSRVSACNSYGCSEKVYFF